MEGAFPKQILGLAMHGGGLKIACKTSKYPQKSTVSMERNCFIILLIGIDGFDGCNYIVF